MAADLVAGLPSRMQRRLLLFADWPQLVRASGVERAAVYRFA